MIVQLRYYVDTNEAKIYVKWNWENVADDAQVSCSLQKCINGDEVARIDEITLSYYDENLGGCAFDMPNEPVKIVVYDEDGSMYMCPVKESPRYDVQFKVKIASDEKDVAKQKEPKGLNKLVRSLYKKKEKTVPKRYHLSVQFPSQLGKAEMQAIEGWVIFGKILADNRVMDRFFLPFLKEGICIYPPFVYKKAETIDIELGTVPEAVGSIYEDLFTYRKVTEFDKSTTMKGKASEAIGIEVPFDNLMNQGDANCEPIICPFCFQEFRQYEAEFRAKYFGDQKSFPKEVDESYKKFCTEHQFNVQVAELPLGKVLRFKTGEDIKSFSYISNPTVFHAADQNELTDIVSEVIDKFGNHSTDKLCPHCHNSIPISSGKYRNLFITMMGNTGSGKSVYMMKMIHLLKSGRLLPGYRFVCTANNNMRSAEILRRYKSIFEKEGDWQEFGNLAAEANDNLAAPLLNYNQSGTTIFGATGFSQLFSDDEPSNWAKEEDATNKVKTYDASEVSPLEQEYSGEEVDAESWEEGVFDKAYAPIRSEALPQATPRIYEEPCIYELRGVNPKNMEQVGFILSIFDFPGEAIWGTHQNGMATAFDRHLEEVIRLSSGFIFMFDPSSIKKVRSLSDEKISRFMELTLGKSGESRHTLLSQHPSAIFSSFNKQFGNPSGRFKAPIAMVLSKADAIRDRLEDLDARAANSTDLFLEERVSSMQNNRTKVDLENMKMCSNIIKKFVNEAELDNLCDQRTEKYLWFSVSATGVAPEDSRISGKRGVSVRVLDPIEWILLENYRSMSKS
jgi:hypothetical protein